MITNTVIPLKITEVKNNELFLNDKYKYEILTQNNVTS